MDSEITTIGCLSLSIDSYGNVKIDVDGAPTPPVRLNNADAIALARYIVQEIDISAIDLFEHPDT
jgi:hypothetical protein